MELRPILAIPLIAVFTMGFALMLRTGADRRTRLLGVLLVAVALLVGGILAITQQLAS